MKRSTKTGITAGTAAILLALQGLLSGLQQANRANCEVFVGNPHTSSSIKGVKQMDALKINPTTSCDREQLRSTLEMKFFRIDEKGTTQVADFPKVTQLADKKYPNKAFFTQFFKKCTDFQSSKYYGYAEGSVLLRNGKTIQVKGLSSKNIYVNCFIGAK